MEIEAAAAGSRVPCSRCGAPTEVPRTRPGPGWTIGGFKIVRLIGVGGMGEVYLARQLSLDRDVALKIFPPELTADKERVQRFLNEVRLLARLEHPSIVTAHEAGQDDGVLFMAMAYINGEPLDALIEREGALSEKRALAIVRKVAVALAYAWNEHRLLHRDIKPSNILLDAHGEPKIADLGLSRTVDKRTTETVEHDILGTPNYMSPEQVEGRSEIDCRSDMYSLGATLYHMLTGHLPFEADSVMETLRQQLSETLPDPRVFQPGISDPCVHLMEILLAKEPAARHPTWEALIADLDRVRAGQMPTRRPMIKGGSALRREHDEHALAEVRRVRLSAAELQKIHQSAGSARRSRRSPYGALSALVLLAALAGAVIWAMGRARPKAPVSPAPPPPAPIQEDLGAPQPKAEDRAAMLETAWADLEQELQQRPDDFDRLIARLRGFLTSARGTPLEAEAAFELRRVRERRHRALQQTSASIEAQIRALVEKEQFEEALRFLDTYDGPFVAETAAQRQGLATDIRSRMAAQAAKRQAEVAAAFESLNDEIAAAVLRQDAAAVQAALDRARPMLADTELVQQAEALAVEAEQACRLSEIVLGSFRSDMGRALPIALVPGTETWEVGGVLNGRVHLRRPVGGGLVERDASYEDLAPAERLRRVGPLDDPFAQVLRGVMLAGAGRTDQARRYLESAETPLSRTLLVYLDRLAVKQREASARAALENLARLARTSLEDRTMEEAARSVRRSAYSTAEIGLIRSSLATYRQEHADANLTSEAAPLLAALENVHTIPREVDPPVISAALEGLRRGPPPLERLNHAINVTPDGIELVLVGNPDLTNLSALAGLPLTRLNIAGCAVRDLSPLKGLPLRSMDASGCPLASLNGLEGAPLTVANFEGCPIESLEPLRGAPLTEINLCRTLVRSLAPLAGAPLKKLLADDAEIESLDPLAGAPLEELSARGNLRITSLTALAGLPLRRMNLADTAIEDLRPLAGLPLRELHLGGCLGVRDLSPLKDLSLRSLAIYGTRVNDLAPLAGLRLQRLEAGQLPNLMDISPLQGQPLTHLWLNDTAVNDLTPLAESPLVQLDLRRTPVRDLTPLTLTPLEILFLDGCPRLGNAQLLPVLEMKKLVTLTLPAPEVRPNFLRRHPTLQQIGFAPDHLQTMDQFFNP